VTEECLTHGADIHAWDDRALRQVVTYKRHEVIKILLTNGANIHCWHDYPLNMATTIGDKTTIQMLLNEYKKKGIEPPKFEIKRI
jgi:hypothetical protein